MLGYILLQNVLGCAMLWHIFCLTPHLWQRHTSKHKSDKSYFTIICDSVFARIFNIRLTEQL